MSVRAGPSGCADWVCLCARHFSEEVEVSHKRRRRGVKSSHSHVQCINYKAVMSLRYLMCAAPWRLSQSHTSVSSHRTSLISAARRARQPPRPPRPRSSDRTGRAHWSAQTMTLGGTFPRVIIRFCTFACAALRRSSSRTALAASESGFISAHTSACEFGPARTRWGWWWPGRAEHGRGLV